MCILYSILFCFSFDSLDRINVNIVDTQSFLSPALGGAVFLQVHMGPHWLFVLV